MSENPSMEQRAFILPTSFAQERMWFLDQLEPCQAAYNVVEAFHLAGPLNVTALERSIQEIVQRHESLRTTFSALDGQPVQVITPALDLTIPVVDLHESPDSDRDAEARRLVEEEVQCPFDLARGPLFRATLLRLDVEQHILILAMHHIVSDEWSLGILHQELSALYEAFTRGEPSPLPDLPIQYADYAAWQRERLQGEVLARQLDYWRRQLDGAPPALDLPSDYPRPPVQTYRGARQSMEIPETLSRALKELGRRESATLFMTLLAAFKTLLFRLTGQDDVVVGTPIAGRTRPEVEGLIGFFLNSLVLRTNLSGQPTFLELLRRVRETAMEAYDHQDLPFEGLLEKLQPQRDLGRTPLFQVFFNLYPGEESPFTLSRLRVRWYELDYIRSNFDLTAYVWEESGNVRVDFVYNADLFDQDRMTEMLAQYQHLLEQIAENPEQRLSSLSLVTPAAKKLLPDPTLPLSGEWQGAIHRQFAERARQAPEHMAVVDEHEQWTYQELDRWSNRLANYLRANGIQPQDIVAIFGHRSAALVWAILGVLKAGAAFLLLDPAYPPARLADYLRTVGPRGWIQTKATGDVPEPLEAFLAASPLCCRLTLPSQAEAQSHHAFGSHPTDDPALTVGPDDLAYVAFTSGSTGMPKAILGRHGPLTHFMPWQQETFDLSPADHFSMLSGLSHDPLQRDIFTPLWIGATVCSPDDDTIGTPGGLADWMAREKISFVHLTPAMSQILTETAGPERRLPFLRYAFFVGDKLTQVEVQRLTSLAPNVTCINSYGSTETQRAVAYYTIPPNAQRDRAKAVYPLGSGMPDAQLLVLNGERKLAGVGELGEIHIRSPHLARGYLGDEPLTRERFLTSPFTNLEYDRLYKTGDLGRYLPDGTVEFAGRNDHQVKIRGFRIELGEIEAVLSQHDDIQEAVVLAREDQPGQIRLVAYVVPAQEPAPAGADLRGHLSARLPAYMVPSAFVALDALPLTPNRKLDRRALPAPDRVRSELEAAYVAPRTPAEEKLAGIWTQILGMDRVGVHDSFFDVGGHSLLGVRLFAQIRKEFGESLPLTTLFQAPTIALQAGHLGEGGKQQSVISTSLIAIRSTGSRVPLFFLPGNLGNVFADLGILSRQLGPDQPFYGLQDGMANPVRIEALAAYYLEQLREVKPEGPYLLGGVCAGAVVAFEMAQQLQAQGQQVPFLAMVEPAGQRGPGIGAYLDLAWSVLERLLPRFGKHARQILSKPSSGQVDYVRLKLKVIANRLALVRYRPQPYHGRLDLFLTEDSLRIDENSQLDWCKLALLGAEVHEFPGNHATIVGLDVPIEETHMQALAAKLRARIDHVLSNG